MTKILNITYKGKAIQKPMLVKLMLAILKLARSKHTLKCMMPFVSRQYIMIFLCCQIILPKICLVITCKIMSKERCSQNKNPCKVEHLFPRNTLLWGRYLTWSVFYIRYKIIVFRFFLQYLGQTQMVWKEKKKRSSIMTNEMLIRVAIFFFKMPCLLQRKSSAW